MAGDGNSEQALFPGVRSSYDLLRDMVEAPRTKPLPPRIIAVPAAPNSGVKCFGDRLDIKTRKLQNCGTVPVKICVNMNPALDNNGAAAQPSTESFHHILAAGNAKDDGLGSMGDYSQFEGEVWAYVDGAVAGRLSTFETLTPDVRVS